MAVLKRSRSMLVSSECIDWLAPDSVSTITTPSLRRTSMCQRPSGSGCGRGVNVTA